MVRYGDFVAQLLFVCFSSLFVVSSGDDVYKCIARCKLKYVNGDMDKPTEENCKSACEIQANTVKPGPLNCARSTSLTEWFYCHIWEVVGAVIAIQLLMILVYFIWWHCLSYSKRRYYRSVVAQEAEQSGP
uniref:Uncharacterized protein n=1 Tax=Chromera velia CCMP2878 TaxID=1169474 RepID=A0A0G4FCM5_9ALVE|mmetsp:Transcript_32219/g.63939  ORF Transcript_32219/g.63939 Transcript_32219/m.63939 type:complete len:131 (-) Transcript_32219:316-708(-)|eukprot:Cvel_16166.t1-p1 / transcript=Cvel_16166.t1 / gene=Cvel_16166 / organism=Chromera_velia_CCMP2878 / gene_product=hypothetical protein / transcript_product=hypothetical protein / location=Cvel_scaffold1232:15811-19481(+) / protein_length=130 / sequence_SO=supercontig / SO=protein_coding / is_pseudo=false